MFFNFRGFLVSNPTIYSYKTQREMKNRLQFNRIPTLFTSGQTTVSGTTVGVSGRDKANSALTEYITRRDFIPLIGEPIVTRYIDDKGKKQLILAIGKATGQTANDTYGIEYHVIDTAKLTEDVNQANENAFEALELASAATKDTADYLTILKNMILSGIGLSDGTYFDNNGRWDRDPSGVGLYDPEKVDETFYLKEATSFLDADKKLDAALVATNAWFNGRVDHAEQEIEKEHGYRKAIAIKEIDQQYYERLGLGDDIKAAYFLTTHKPGDGNFDQYDYPQNGEVIIKVYKDEVSREEFENVLAAEGLNPDGTYDHERAHDSINFKDAFDAFTADELLDRAIADLSANTMAANDELNNDLTELSAATVAIETKEENIITAAGLNPDGTFNHNHESNYMDESNSLVENDMALDATIYELSANTMAADNALNDKIDELSANTMAADQALEERIEELEGHEIFGQDAIETEEDENGDTTVSLKIYENEKVLSQSNQGLRSTIKLAYVPAEKKIYLNGIDDVEISHIDTDDFVKDGMLDSANIIVATEEDHAAHPELVVGETYIKLVFNTDAEQGGKQTPVFISAKDLVDEYKVSATSLNYLTIEGYEIRANVDEEHGLAGYDGVMNISAVTDNIIEAAGLNMGQQGSYPGHDETHFIKNATSLDNADVLLDEAIWGLSGNTVAALAETNDDLAELSAATQSFSSTTQTYFNNILAGTGLNTGNPGEYGGHDETHYIKDATSLDNADTLLDAAIWETSGLVADISNRVDELSAITESFSAHTVEALSALSSSVDERIESGLTIISGVVENYVEAKLSGLNFDEIYEYIDSADTALYQYIDESVEALSGALLDYIIDNEEVTAAALNDLNTRTSYIETHMTGEYIPITNYTIATGTTEEELVLDDDDTVNEAFGKLQKQILDNEESVAAGLNDLNRRVNENAALIAQNTGVTALSAVVQSFSSATYNTFNQFGDTINNINNNISVLCGITEVVSGLTDGVLTVELNGEVQGKYSPSADTLISLTAITEVTGADVLLTGYELASGTTEEELAIVATDTVNEAFGKVQKQIYDDEAVIAGALNDLNDRINDITASTGGDVSALSASVVNNQTNINNLSSATLVLSADVANCFDDAEYDSNTKRINFKHGNTVLDYIDATDFIKDGMVDNVVVGVPTTGTHAGETCLIITFNTDSGKEEIDIPVSDIFDPSTLDELSASVVSNQTKITTISGDVIALSAAVVGDIVNLNELSASVVNNRTDIDALSANLIDDEYVIAAALNDLNSRVLDLEDATMDPSNYYTKQETYNKQEINELVQLKYKTGNTLTNLDFSEYLTIVTVGSDTTLSVASTGLPELPAMGVKQAHVMINNTGSSPVTVTIANDSRVKATTGNTIAIDAGGYGELDALITYNGSAYTIYVITT